MANILLPRRPMVLATTPSGKHKFIDPPKGNTGETILVSLWKQVDDE